ncbi:metallophosphoesterase [Parabacteroides sp. ZJ-118]|uniref:metallophosphoesterase n=1 Tax=Parabacteroides sp. ZJ-118 TaxID=2709398 RepID=UPI001F152365|nr:metallophosphoesterase [Parabacteroides sp. ZJ-118]
MAAPAPTGKAFDIPPVSEKSKNFYLVSDLGRNGYYEQKTIAELMGNLAEKIDIEFIAAAGDTHHFEGVASVDDPLWMTNYELVYSHPELMLEWYAVCGNHEYRGNTQAVLDYSKKSRRWIAPSRYYAKVVEAGENEKALLLFIDTSPLIDKYRNDTAKYPDAGKQDREAQLRWIEQTLAASTEEWKIVIGHHPVYADTPKEESERADMRKYLEPLLDKYGVDIYFCGHIHNFQHIRPAGSEVDYLVNSSGSLPRKVKAIEGTQFCSPEAGFTVVSLEDGKLSFYLMNGKGKILYAYSRTRS